jgi:hypothetical protein
MGLKNDVELANTRAKLSRMEVRYEQLRAETGGDEHVRELTLRSLKRYINQFKEEIVRYEAHSPAHEPAGMGNERELANTREKLQELEMLYEADKSETGGDKRVREAELVSIKRLINQLKEEIVRYESHHAVRG